MDDNVLIQKRMRLHVAQEVAQRIVAHLHPHTTRIMVAGSIRRGAAEVGDVEIVCSPVLDWPADLFHGQMRPSLKFVQAVLALGDILKGNPSAGRYVKIDIRNKKGEHVIQCDLFIPQPHDYWRQVAIRTGSAGFSGYLARQWVQRGWVGTTDGLRRRDECTQSGDTWTCTTSSPTLPPIWESEQDFFTWLQIPYVQPQDRNV